MTFSPCSHPRTWPGLLSHPSLVPELLSPPPRPLPCSQGRVQNQHSCSCPALKPPMAPHCLLNQSHSAPPGVPDASQGRHGLLVQAHVPVTTLTLSQGAYHTLPSSMLLLMKCPRLECLSTFTTRAGLSPVATPVCPLYLTRSSVHFLTMPYRKGSRMDAFLIVGSPVPA